MWEWLLLLRVPQLIMLRLVDPEDRCCSLSCPQPPNLTMLSLVYTEDGCCNLTHPQPLTMKIKSKARLLLTPVRIAII